MIFSCTGLIACDFSEIFGKMSSSKSTEPASSEPTKPSEQPTQSTTQPTEPTSSSSSTTEEEPQPEPEELVFEHGDNFTEEDIEFVKSFQGYHHMLSCTKIFTFSKMVEEVKIGREYLYYVDVDIENPYYICAYMDFSIVDDLNKWGAGCIDITRYVWYKFDAEESIPKEIDNLRLGWAFQIYDSVITKDIGNDIDCEHKFKFYSLGYGGVSNFRVIYEHMLIIHHRVLDDIGITIEEVPKSGRYYEVGKVADEQLYLKLYSDALYEDGTISNADNHKFLEYYYDILLPYIQRVEELDCYFVNVKGETLKLLYLGIDLDDLSQVLFMK